MCPSFCENKAPNEKKSNAPSHSSLPGSCLFDYLIHGQYEVMISTGQTCHQRAYHWVFDCVHQSDDVGPSSQVLQDLDLSLDLLLLDRLIPQGNAARETKTEIQERGLRVQDKQKQNHKKT